jgi:hypothetical protein
VILDLQSEAQSELKCLKFGVPKVTRKCHPEAKPKDLVNEKEILHFAALRSE